METNVAQNYEKYSQHTSPMMNTQRLFFNQQRNYSEQDQMTSYTHKSLDISGRFNTNDEDSVPKE